MSAQIVPSSTSNDRSSSAVTPPNRTPTSLTLSSGTATPYLPLLRRGGVTIAMPSRPTRLRARSHEHHLQLVVGLDAAARAEHDALERRVDERDRNLGDLGQPVREAAQHAAATHEV